MKTALSLPDDLFDEAEALADRLGVSRSELYRRAVRHYVKLHDPEAVTRAIDRACDAAESTTDDQAFARRAASRTAERNEWT